MRRGVLTKFIYRGFLPRRSFSEGWSPH